MTDMRGKLIRPLSLSGFTLLEILVAIALLGIALSVIFQLFSANLRGIAASDEYARAVLKAEATMREVLDEDDLAPRSWSDTTEDGYRVDGTITEAAVERTDKLPVDLLEVRLALHWTRGEKEKTITLTTMKVVKKKI